MAQLMGKFAVSQTPQSCFYQCFAAQFLSIIGHVAVTSFQGVIRSSLCIGPPTVHSKSLRHGVRDAHCVARPGIQRPNNPKDARASVTLKTAILKPT